MAVFEHEAELASPHAIDATCFRSCVCAMARRLTKVHAMARQDGLLLLLI